MTRQSTYNKMHDSNDFITFFAYWFDSNFSHVPVRKACATKSGYGVAAIRKSDDTIP